MQIKFNDYDLENFRIKEGDFCGIPSKLIQPSHLGTEFTQKNKIFRSSIWSLTGELLSGSYPKFKNWNEDPENFPIPTSLNNTNILTKIDGSTCIIDHINNQTSMRSRGTFSYSTLENSDDFEYCLSKYPKINDWLINNQNYSLLTEITSPRQKIVIDYGNEPDFWLTGAINKEDYSLMPQKDLDKLGIFLNIPRPIRHTFNTISELLDIVKQFKELEGVCLYSSNDQKIFKIKADIYLKKHYFKSNATLGNTIDLFFAYEKPSYQEFISKITNDFDNECSLMIVPFISKIISSYDKVNDNISRMREVVTPLLSLSRKDSALIILESYKYHSSYLFKLLSGKELDDRDIRKLLISFLE
jgi:hypothetical protein